jgi:uncharacterized membrane protein YidH (DUF202 family)
MRPDTVFDPLFQHERTALAWERTAISGMVVGALMTRVGVTIHVALGALGLAQVCASAALLVWAGRHYEDLHGVLRSGDSPAHPTGAALVGIGATLTTVLATLLAAVAVATQD